MAICARGEKQLQAAKDHLKQLTGTHRNAGYKASFPGSGRTLLGKSDDRKRRKRKLSKKLHLVSLGCDKNLSDSEKMLRMAADRGYELTDEPSEADVILVNTCAFILDAQDESVQTILEMAEAKKQAAQLIVAGCLAERYKDEIKIRLLRIFHFSMKVLPLTLLVLEIHEKWNTDE